MTVSESGLGEPVPVSALHGVGTAELLESMFDQIATKQRVIKGFGTNVKNLKVAKDAMNFKVPLEGEDDEDFRLRKKYHRTQPRYLGGGRLSILQCIESKTADTKSSRLQLSLAYFVVPSTIDMPHIPAPRGGDWH